MLKLERVMALITGQEEPLNPDDLVRERSLTEMEMDRLESSSITILGQEMEMQKELKACLSRSEELQRLIAESVRVRSVLDATRNHLRKSSPEIEQSYDGSSLVGLTVKDLEHMTGESQS